MNNDPISCLACNGSTRFVTRRRSRDYDKSPLYDIHRCNECSSFTADCRYTPELYDEQYYLIAEDAHVHDPQMYHYAKVVDRLAVRNGAVPAILDVGCGSGKFLHTYAGVVPDAALHGLEINPDAVKRIRENLPASEIFGSYQELGDRSFDIVCAWNVIEHVPKPGDFLAELAAHVKPGGLVSISTPNHAQINRWSQGMDKWEAIDPPHHLCILSHAALKKLFVQCNLQLVHLSTFSWHFGGYYSPPRWWKPKYMLPHVLGKLRLGGNLLMIGRKT